MTYRELLKIISEFDDERLDMRVKAYSSGDYYPLDEVRVGRWSTMLVLGADLEEDE